MRCKQTINGIFYAYGFYPFFQMVEYVVSKRQKISVTSFTCVMKTAMTMAMSSGVRTIICSLSSLMTFTFNWTFILTAIQWFSMFFQWHSKKFIFYAIAQFIAMDIFFWRSLRLQNCVGNFMVNLFYFFYRSETIWKRWVGNQKYFYVLICQTNKEHRCKWFLVFDFGMHWVKL